MVKLNEYLGSIASSVAEARLVSDLKSLEVAEQFAKHNLLKHFSVPRFKAENIELTIPVAIAEVSTGNTMPYIPIEDKNAFAEKTIVTLKEISPISVKPIPENELKLISETNKQVIVLEKNLQLGSDLFNELNTYAQSIVKIYFSIYPPLTSRIDMTEIANTLRDKLKPYVNPKPVVSEEKIEPKVIVEGHKLKELPPENVIQIKMTLKEEGMEWHISEDENGIVTTKLLPE
ncbi:hypothetical protein ACSIGC_11270 [Tenacibaculum sp. ZS6-P6]|uniref:hypothetical protein n=1 Tax=Tenacibaculum sp. ZS6-P6 TaxID=3447503 RepID=UPI003F9B7108